MAEQIKSFFRKKVSDKKFKRAGKGYKLNEASTPSSSTSSKETETPKRHEPTMDAKVAGQATLARIEAKKVNDTKFNTSYAAIQAHIKKELQQEKLALMNQSAQANKRFSNELMNTEEPEIISHMSAVSGIYYQCPLVSEEILDKETWYERIEAFFSTQLLDDEIGLSACLVIHSCNDGEERISNCVETLCKYLDNIIKNPTEEKYWKIRMSNKIFQEKVKNLKGSMELLKAAGFIQEKLVNQDKEEDFLIWSPERSSLDNLKTLIDALNSAEPVQLILDRNVHVLLPTQAAERTELPAEFYVFSLDDLKYEQATRSNSLKLNQVLMTASMREKFMNKPVKKYRFTLIRIKFPDNIILQGTFDVTETLKEVVQFIRDHLFDKNIMFNLITDTRQVLTEADYEKTLETLQLVPAIILTFSSKHSTDSAAPSQFLNEKTLSLLES